MANFYLKNVVVMIVDDQPSIRSMLRHILRVLGCQKIIDFDSAEDAWGYSQVTPVDLALIDWEMKPMNGIDLIRKIRNDPVSLNPFMSIIMVTGHSEIANIVFTRDAGVTEYLVKPISAKTLLNRINNVIEHPRQFVRIGEYFGPDRRRRDANVKDDRRGVEAATQTDGAAASTSREMSQDEVNAFMNPDSVPPPDNEEKTAQTKR